MYAVDLEAARLARVSNRFPWIHTLVASADAVPDIPDTALDAVISTMVMEHVPDEHAYLAEIQRMLRPGGRAYVTTVFKKPWAWYFRKRDGESVLDTSHLREYTDLDQVRELVASAGPADPRARTNPDVVSGPRSGAVPCRSPPAIAPEAPAWAPRSQGADSGVLRARARRRALMPPLLASAAVATTSTLVQEKLDQAVEILREQEIDLWLTFVRETMLTNDPCLDLIAGVYSAWTGAFMVSATGERIAIVGRFDAPSVEQVGGYEVIGYDESIKPALLAAVERLDPRSIALNYSTSDPAADGLTHGLWLELQETFADTPFAQRFRSSEKLVNALRGRKSAAEVERIQAAARETEEIFDSVGRALRADLSETEIAALMHDEVARRGLGYAWGRDHCPAVNAGPEKEVGHAPPGELRTRRGELLHIDFGVSRDSYASDLQRVWYFLDEGETAPPDDVVRAWDALWASVDAGAAALMPGAAGWEVDAAARESLVAAGYPEPMHALGHQLGRSAHDGGTTLAPRWDRYGSAPFGLVEAGNVFTLEYGTAVPGRGYIGLEEDVLVTDDGIEWLSTPQRELWLVTS